MEPVTHALTSLAIARAAQKRLPRFGTAMIVVSGVAADLDFASYLGGPGAFLRFHRTAFHSLFGSAVMVCAIAWFFTFADKKIARKARRFQFSGRIAAWSCGRHCAIGAAGHLLLDLASGIGVQLLWPFHSEWFSLRRAGQRRSLDSTAANCRAAAPAAVSRWWATKSATARRKTTRRCRRLCHAADSAGRIVGARSVLHSQATALLLSREYHGREPLSGASFPYSTTPLEWRGVVVTDNTIELADVPLAPGTEFDPDRGVTRYKPDDSPALEKAQATAVAERFLKYARFPLANIDEDRGRLPRRNPRSSLRVRRKQSRRHLRARGFRQQPSHHASGIPQRNPRRISESAREHVRENRSG